MNAVLSVRLEEASVRNKISNLVFTLDCEHVFLRKVYIPDEKWLHPNFTVYGPPS